MLLALLAAATLAASPTPDAVPQATPPPAVQILSIQPNSYSAANDPQKVYALALRPTSQTLAAISEFLNRLPMLVTLLILVGIDIVMGSCVAFTQKRVSSTVSWRGMVRKAGTFLIVGMAAAIEPYAGLPLAKLMCIFFVYTEAISIVEAAAGLGIPLPPQLLAALIKLRDSDKALIVVPAVPVAVAPSPVTVVVNRDRAAVRQSGQTTRVDLGQGSDVAATADRTDAINRNTVATEANTAAQVTANGGDATL